MVYYVGVELCVASNFKLVNGNYGPALMFFRKNINAGPEFPFTNRQADEEESQAC